MTSYKGASIMRCGQLGIVIDLKKGLIKWNEAQAQMQDIDFTRKVIYNIDDSRHVQNATNSVKKTLDKIIIKLIFRAPAFAIPKSVLWLSI